MAERMSDLEALMWTLEKDPHLSSTFANVTVFDRPPDIARLRSRMERALQAGMEGRTLGEIETALANEHDLDERRGGHEAKIVPS